MSFLSHDIGIVYLYCTGRLPLHQHKCPRMTRHYFLLPWQNVKCISHLLGALLDSISTRTPPHGPQEHSHLEPVPPILFIMPWAPQTEILNSSGSETIQVCRDLYPGLSSLIVTKRTCFLSIWTTFGLVGNWSTSMCSRNLILQEGARNGKARGQGWLSPWYHGERHLSGTKRNPVFSNANLTIQDFMKVYLSK